MASIHSQAALCSGVPSPHRSSAFRPLRHRNCLKKRCPISSARNEPWACMWHGTARRCAAPRQPHVVARAVAAAAANAAAAATAAARPDGGGGDGEDGELAVEEESLQILEWPAVCRQVSCFCRTPMAAERVAAGLLPLGATRAESERLLRLTEEAVTADLPLDGILDLRPALQAAASGVQLNAAQLEGVAASIEAALRLREAATAAKHADAAAAFPLLAQLAAGISAEERDTVAALRACIAGGLVSDEADPGLAATRAERRANLAEVRRVAGATARDLAARGAAESREPLLVRGRFCVAVRASRRSELPKGSVKLGASASGATAYVEPAACVALNNLEAELAGREDEQVSGVLSRLSELVARRAGPLAATLAAVAALDVAAARARHARWIGGVRPVFVDDGGDGNGGGDPAAAAAAAAPSPMHAPGLLHPLLLEPSLSPLPRAPRADDAPFESDFRASPMLSLAAAVADSARGANGAAAAAPRAPPPKPLNLSVPGATRVVAITGPNTGGKTVALKAAGLLAVMARAGLFVPIAAAESSERQQQQHHHHHQPPPPPRLRFFSPVLADIGDAQSLQQSLSTFSGHVRRLRRVLAAAGPRALALLDEAGSGTDPGEGAALARAVLDALADRAGLTLATTHHAELRGVAAADARYASASMGFDTASLRPTYALQWGNAGASNALDIAERLGFDGGVIADARALAASEEAARAAAAADMERVAASVQAQLAETQARLKRRREAREAAEARLAAARSAERELASLRGAVARGPALVSQVVANAVLKLQLDVANHRRGAAPREQLEQRLAALEASLPPHVQARLKKLAAKGSSGVVDGGDDDGDDDDVASAIAAGAAESVIAPGDRVAVPRLGALGEGTVLRIEPGNVAVVEVQVPLPGGLSSRRGGSSKVRVPVDEVVRTGDVAAKRRQEQQQRQQEQQQQQEEGQGEEDQPAQRGAYSSLLARVDDALAALGG